MSGNAWIIIGIISAAISVFSIPYGFHLKGKEQSQKEIQISGDLVAGDKVTTGGDYIAGDKITNIGPVASETIVKCSQYQNESCPLKIIAFSFENPPPKNSKHAGINWHEYNSETE